MAYICATCTTRYATGLDNCPQCQSPDRHDEHDEPASVAAGKPKSKRKTSADQDDGAELTTE